MRQLPNWIEAYQDWASITEAPKIFHFWCGISALSGALRRKVWLDRLTYKWYPSFYIVLVAPPGIVGKSTTADLALDLLREVPGIKFGPDVITWQSLVSSFAESYEAFQIGDLSYPMSAMVIVSSELGLFLNMQDRDMVNLLITLWDGRSRLEKKTKMSGNDSVDSPWMTLLGCTTPKAISENMPRSAVGGGFTSRCIFVFRDVKEKLVANPSKLVKSTDWMIIRKALVSDLEHISMNLAGEYKLTHEADQWEEEWYAHLWDKVYPTANTEVVQAYLSRKQTHLCKLAMVLAASQRDELVIEAADLALANQMLMEVEDDLLKVFDLIGKSEMSQAADKLIALARRRGKMPYGEFVNTARVQFPDSRDLDGMINGLTAAGLIEIRANGSGRDVLFIGESKVIVNVDSLLNVNTNERSL